MLGARCRNCSETPTQPVRRRSPRVHLGPLRSAAGAGEEVAVVGAEVSVLVIGDDEDCFVETVLKAEGWEVTTADAGDAVARVEAQRPDLVVLYSGRFGLGLEVCSALRSRSRVPVIVLSRSSSEDDVVAGLRGGADAMVVEGIGAREFVARARALLRR